MRCVWTQINIKKKKILKWRCGHGVRTCWRMDALRVLADGDGGWGCGRVARPCGCIASGRMRRRKRKRQATNL